MISKSQPADPGVRLRLSGICKQFGGTRALDRVNLEIVPGEVHALIGENGAGKSTLMKILSGVYQPDSGEMWLDGNVYSPSAPGEARKQGIVMVHQELSIAPHLTVTENLVLGAEPSRFGLLDHRKAREIAAATLRQLGREDIPLSRAASRLSVADQQLVEIGRALILGCRVLVLDEPTSSLTRSDTEKLFGLVRRLREQGQSIIYISHFLEEVQELSDRYTVLRDGASVATGRTEETTPGKLAEMMVGRQVDELYAHATHHPAAVVLEVKELAGALKPVSASLQLRRGEVVGVAGVVGAGRSELIRAIFGLDAVRGGHVSVATYQGAGTPARRWSQGVGFLSEDRKVEGLALNRSIEENLTWPKLDLALNPSKLEAEAQVWIEKLGVRCAGPGQIIGQLSGGNQQKIALGRLLRNGAEVLLLDEPTRGVDVGAKEKIYRLIDELAVGGKAVLMVSSYLPELLGTCDRIAVMCRGVLGPARPVAEWSEHRIMLEATGAVN